MGSATAARICLSWGCTAAVTDIPLSWFFFFSHSANVARLRYNSPGVTGQGKVRVYRCMLHSSSSKEALTHVHYINLCCGSHNRIGKRNRDISSSWHSNCIATIQWVHKLRRGVYNELPCVMVIQTSTSTFLCVWGGGGRGGRGVVIRLLLSKNQEFL